MAQSIVDALRLGDARSMSMEAAEVRWGRMRARYSMGHLQKPSPIGA
jgi:hypothetical protein